MPKEEKNKISESLENLTKNENIENIVTYAKKNTRDTIAYVLLLLGLVWMLVEPFFGGVLVGLIVGYYFSPEIIDFAKGFNKSISQAALARRVVLSTIAVVFFLLAPGIFFGIAIIVALKFLLKVE